MQNQAKEPIDPEKNVDAEEVRQNFTDAVAKIHHDIQSDGFFTWIVAEDDHNSSKHVIQLDQVSRTFI